MHSIDPDVELFSCTQMQLKGGICDEIMSYGIRGKGGEWVPGIIEDVDVVSRKESETYENVTERLKRVNEWGNYILCFRKK